MTEEEIVREIEYIGLREWECEGLTQRKQSGQGVEQIVELKRL